MLLHAATRRLHRSATEAWFSSVHSYWSTVLHEVIHRSERILGFNGSEWAGELRAEVGAALLESILGLPHCPDQTNYRLWRPAWLMEWHDDPASMVRAVASGVEAAEFLLSYPHEDQLVESMESRACPGSLVWMAH